MGLFRVMGIVLAITCVWAFAAFGFFDVEIVETNAPIVQGEVLKVTATVMNDSMFGFRHPVELRDFDGNIVDTDRRYIGPGDTVTFELSWQTEVGDAGTGMITFAYIHAVLGEYPDTKEIRILEEPPLYFDGWSAPLDTPRDRYRSGSTLPVKFIVVDADGVPVTEGVEVDVQVGESDWVTAELADPNTGMWQADVTLEGSGTQEVILDGNVQDVPLMEIEVFTTGRR